jgi:hypothetical protein
MFQRTAWDVVRANPPSESVRWFSPEGFSDTAVKEW